jgi:hypothetical protein
MLTVGPGARTEERRALLQRVLWSRQIQKAARIREFLSYVCEKGLSDPAVEIHEQEIGVSVFGRKAGYDTMADNVVRVTASQTRRKLEQYFATDGASEPVVLEIPKGKYAPLFHERAAALPDGEPPDLPPPARSLATPVLWVCVILLAGATIWLAILLHLARPARAEVEASPTLRALWDQLLPSPRAGHTDLVIADSSLSLFQELLDHQLTLAEYLNPGQWMPADKFASNPELRMFASRAAQRRFTSLASVTAVHRIGQLAGPDHSRISIFSARDFNIRQMKSDNVVLLGSSRANPWVELIQDRLNFRFAFDQQSRYSYFVNRSPKEGEPRAYQTDSTVSYCAIAFLPNLDRTGNILAIAGTEVEGTEGGSEFVTSERALAQVTKVAKIDRNGRLPYFESLLKSTRVGGAASEFSIVSVRLLHP